MIIGVGIDLMDVARIKEQVLIDNDLKATLFTPTEIEHCEAKKWQAQHYAARYAAKEAFFKALGVGLRQGMVFNEIEILANEMGKPEIVVSGTVKEMAEKLEIKNMQVSISHLKDYACAIVILEA
ncbi:MAG: holo-ACP synthase [Chloroflexi bacterium]|nr:holo-ACP synthase [Chloroflexota bacterium]